MIFPRISGQIPEKSGICRLSIKFAKTNQKIAENSEICGNYSLLFIIIHHPLLLNLLFKQILIHYYSLLFIIIHYYSFVSLFGTALSTFLFAPRVSPSAGALSTKSRARSVFMDLRNTAGAAIQEGTKSGLFHSKKYDSRATEGLYAGNQQTYLFDIQFCNFSVKVPYFAENVCEIHSV